MNVQNIQILFLLLDSVMMLAPWRIVTKTMDRIGYAAGRRFVRSLCIRSLGIIAVVCIVLHVFPPVSMLGAVVGVGDLTGALDAENTPEEPDRITSVPVEGHWRSGHFHIDLPPYSFVVISFAS